MSVTYVDFHCHLDLFDDFEAKLLQAERSGIYTLAVTTTPRAWPRNKQLTSKLQYVRPALGIHPQLITRDADNELELWDQYLSEARYVGEVGLDKGPNFIRHFDEQKRVFKHILIRCADVGGKIISVHAVKSVDTVLDMIEELLPSDKGIVVLHWFTGTPEQAKRATRLGCYFSVNSSMLNSKRGREVISSIPVGRLLTETDGPFTSETFNQLKQIKATVEVLSNLYGINSKSVTQKLLENLKTLSLFN